MNRVSLEKSPTVYYLILAVWAVIFGLALPGLVGAVFVAGEAGGTLYGVIAAMSAIFIGYFWLNGTKDFVYTAFFHLRMRGRATPVPPRNRTTQPAVVMVYCTCNDFCPESLRRSSMQDYGNYEVVILDDSTKPEYLERVDHYAEEHGVRVIRRADRLGFKAGNLNNFLSHADYDYFVILDSDEVTPGNFISRCLDYFDHYANVGIVQANHVATRNRNRFMQTFAPGVDSHWIAYQTVKDRHGFLSLLGHGAMVSRDCYFAAGGFPMLVAEDLCMSIAARDAGYVTAFAPDVVCEEEYPVDYLSFKKRHSKWTQGNIEFVRRFSGTILRSRMKWFEKLDIVLFTYSLPLTGLFSLYVIMHVVLLPLLGHRIEYPLWMLAPTLAFLLAPMLNDIIFYLRRLSGRTLRRYLLHTVLLYGSMLLTSVRSSTTSLFGKAIFVVTPKKDERLTFTEAVRVNKAEVVFGLSIGCVAIALTGSLLPVLLLVIPALSSTYLAVLHQSAR